MKNAPRKASAILVVLLLAVVAASLFLLNRKQPAVLDTVPEQTFTQEPPAAPLAIGEQGTPDLGRENGMEEEPLALPEAAPDPADFATLQSGVVSENDSCTQVTAELHRFFSHLDQQDYIVAFNPEGGSLAHFSRLLDKLLANPPIMSRETDDLLSILKNMTHFFRVLGKKDLILLKDVLVREKKNIEPIMALFYQWSMLQDRCSAETTLPRLSLPGLYGYAGFFLNTLGGQAYLSRRGGNFRVLFRYYAVLVLDRANDAQLNINGLDIRYPLYGLLNEMEAYQDLKYRNDYLEKLLALKDKYQEHYGEVREKN